ncbi:SDR family oxidoreductase [Fructilactobacillus hinvesii]|uniref:SDR family oxidoreductase n=1 Tax=Fructilactobacillus hinvesii TaxID=2940300 RepID=A0ABY5BUQ7_9LACO|nr:NAD(P)-binding oxidoreductase [Fructilactobacillus hinvesii]USS88172.1 SDR family oxidoreductase [Fructilactobacillus hinvesii]
MTKAILVVGAGPLTTQVEQQFNQAQLNVITKQTQLTDPTLPAAVPDQLAAVVITAGPQDVDLVVDAIVTALQQQRVSVERWILVSAAGIDDEVEGQLEYPGVSDVAEYLREQRYAIKIIDETELSYTIIRPGTLVAQQQGVAQFFNEGQPVPAGVVSYETIANVIAAAVAGKYQNQSIAVIETERESV